MARKFLNGKWFNNTVLVLGIVGGLVHALQALFSYNLLTIFGTFSVWVQGLAGLATLYYFGRVMLK